MRQYQRQVCHILICPIRLNSGDIDDLVEGGHVTAMAPGPGHAMSERKRLLRMAFAATGHVNVLFVDFPR